MARDAKEVIIMDENLIIEPRSDGSSTVRVRILDTQEIYLGRVVLKHHYWVTMPPTHPAATQVEAAEALLARVSRKRMRRGNNDHA